METKSEKNVDWIFAKKVLSDKEKDKELGYEQKNALEHLRKFCKLSDKKAAAIREELEKIEKLKERHINYILNLLPETQDELRIIFSHERIVLSDDEKGKILKIIKENK
jgi:DNA-directed RNA polymerase subunit F